MAGYIMTINDFDSLKKCVETGTYSTIMGDPKNSVWGIPQEGTFADYLSMKSGDSIYFFHKRKIYGIGEVININSDCKYLNYIEADKPNEISDNDYNNQHPLLENATRNNRCFCFFKPSPFFFENGIDMDDVLSSNPSKFRMLRTMWKVSFIKVDDEENKALKDIVLKRNEEYIFTGEKTLFYDEKYALGLSSKINTLYRLNSYQILFSASKDNKIKHEMAIEAALCDILQNENETLFGKWDYISHQVAASPFKPIDYMDKMDIFGYKYIRGFDTISKYLVIEIKKDEATNDAVDQIMKYVDWINQEYTHGDYSMIEAYIVAHAFSDDVIERRDEQCVRKFTKGYRPSVACTWKDCKLVEYRFIDGHLEFSEINND